MRWPLAAILGAQAALSLSLVWSNTVFGDEALYLWAGHLEIAHWLHGYDLPGFFSGYFSGAPGFYPPLGAAIDGIGGIDAARIVALMFMLTATGLLYGSASRLFGRRAALVAAALWAVSEPALRLAFATFDPLSVLLVAVAAWCTTEAGYRPHTMRWVAASAAFLAAANLATYSSTISDPVVVTVAFVAWWPLMGLRRAFRRSVVLAATTLALLGALPTLFGLWPGIMTTVLARPPGDSGILSVLRSSWSWTGLIALLAAVGAFVAAARVERRSRVILLLVLAGASLLVPLEQARLQTGWSLDKHLAYGIWFAAMGAGYTVDTVLRFPRTAPQRITVLLCAAALIFPAARGWQGAERVYHLWPNSSSFIAAFKPLAAQTSRPILIADTAGDIPMYSTPQGHQWRRWRSLPMRPQGITRGKWKTYYTHRLQKGRFGVVVLLLRGVGQAPALPSSKGVIERQVLRATARDSSKPGAYALTQALKGDPNYQLATVGPYNSGVSDGMYVIWKFHASAGAGATVRKTALSSEATGASQLFGQRSL